MPQEADRQRYHELVRLTPGPCLLVAGGVIEAVNPEVSEVIGLPDHRLVGVALGDLLLADFEGAWRHTMEGARETVTVLRSRLAATLAPIELTVRRLDPDRVVVGLRPTTAEHHYSALAGAELTHDPVTGLANRYHLLSQLHHRMTAADRNPLALVGLWIDELPALATTRGQRVVDRVVKEVGGRLQARLRSPDVLGRFDQAGFLALLGSDAAPPQLAEIAERMRAEVAFPVEVDNGLVSFTASVAVGSVSGRRPSIEGALGQLEEAATRASQGGNRTDVLDL